MNSYLVIFQDSLGKRTLNLPNWKYATPQLINTARELKNNEKKIVE